MGMEAAVTPPRCLWVSGMKLRLGRTRAGSKITADRSVNSLLELFLWSARAWLRRSAAVDESGWSSRILLAAERAGQGLEANGWATLRRAKWAV